MENQLESDIYEFRKISKMAASEGNLTIAYNRLKALYQKTAPQLLEPVNMMRRASTIHVAKRDLAASHAWDRLYQKLI